jgi:hypothetical protein
MNLRRFHGYWASDDRKKVLGTERIELSQTKLDGYTKTPLIVSQIFRSRYLHLVANSLFLSFS